MKPCLIVPSPQGQLGNRLFNIANIRAFAMTRGVPMVHCCFHPYAHFFEGTSRSLFCLYDPNKDFYDSQAAQLLAECFKRFLHILASTTQSAVVTQLLENAHAITPRALDQFTSLEVRELFYSFGFTLRAWVQERALSKLSAAFIEAGDEGTELETHPILTKSLTESSLVLVDGWGWRHHGGMVRYDKALREYLTLLPQYRSRVANLLAHARTKGDFIIGVHIRRADYAEWQGGKYFFDYDVYRAVMRSALEKFKDRKVAFLVCGTDKMSAEDFAGFPVVVSQEEAPVDLYSLAECDMTIGPPSTFTGWAKHWGNKPHTEITSPTFRLT